MVTNYSRVDFDTYIQNSLWDLKAMEVKTILSSDRYFDYTRSSQTEDISINLILKRKPLYFMVNNIFPCLILNSVTLIAFSLPFALQIGLSNT